MTIDDIIRWVPTKNAEMMTTTGQSKRDVYEFFHKPEFADKIGVEFGCYQCHSTIVLAQCFKHVYALDNWADAIAVGRKFLDSHGIDNVTIFHQELYNGFPVADYRV
jgi:hypothetical protein